MAERIRERQKLKSLKSEKIRRNACCGAHMNVSVVGTLPPSDFLCVVVLSVL